MPRIPSRQVAGSTRPSPARAAAPSARRTGAAPRRPEPIVLELADPAGGVGGRESRKSSRIRASSPASKVSCCRSLLEDLVQLARGSPRAGPGGRARPAPGRAARAAARRSASRPRKPPGHPPPHQAVERSLGAGPREDLVGEVVEELATPQVRAEGILGVVPPRVADPHPDPAYAGTGGGPGEGLTSAATRRGERRSRQRVRSALEAPAEPAAGRADRAGAPQHD